MKEQLCFEEKRQADKKLGSLTFYGATLIWQSLAVTFGRNRVHLKCAHPKEKLPNCQTSKLSSCLYKTRLANQIFVLQVLEKIELGLLDNL